MTTLEKHTIINNAVFAKEIFQYTGILYLKVGSSSALC